VGGPETLRDKGDEYFNALGACIKSHLNDDVDEVCVTNDTCASTKSWAMTILDGKLLYILIF